MLVDIDEKEYLFIFELLHQFEYAEMHHNDQNLGQYLEERVCYPH